MFARDCFGLRFISAVISFALILFSVTSARAQHAPNPWSGVTGDEAQPVTGELSSKPFSPIVSAHALSRDGRFLVFDSLVPLVADDHNGDWDVYLRDRQTRALTRVSVARDGGDANGASGRSTISSNGRFVVYSSSAGNIVAGDDNELADVFVYDRDRLTTTRVNLGPGGEQSALWDAGVFAISSDGRFVLFGGGFAFSQQQRLWIRDRDADENGVFDETEPTTVTAIPAPVGDESVQLFGFGEVALSGDGRFVAITPIAYTMDGQDLGVQLYVHDRLTGDTQHIAGSAAEPGSILYSMYPDFSDAGHVAYSTNAPDLVPGDSDIDEDAFVFNLFTGGHTRLQLRHDRAPTLVAARNPSISSDGRYVAFVGIDGALDGIQWSNLYGIDLESGNTYEVSVTPDGQRVGRVGDAPSISDDGSAIAFTSLPHMLPDYQGNEELFVATALTLSPAVIEVAPAGGSALIEVAAPATTAWNVKTRDFSMQLDLLQVSAMEGVGSGLLQVSLPPNGTPEVREYWVMVGSEYVTVRQLPGPIIFWVSPSSGSTRGHTEVLIYGTGFAPGATVTFGGVAALDVLVSTGDVIRALTPRQERAGVVDLVVSNPGGASATSAFEYLDETPPVITSRVTGSLGLNGWYTSDVTVEWTVTDRESAVVSTNCPSVTVTADTREFIARCAATSGGGTASRQVAVKRDTTAPEVQIVTPDNRVYAQHASETVTYSCTDGTSGVATCTGTQPGGAPLNTATAGTFAFTVTSEDRAGLRTTRAVNYVVKSLTALQVANVIAPYGSAGLLRVTLLAAGAALPGAPITFLANGEVIGSGVTSASGEASLAIDLSGRDPGTIAIEVRYAGGEHAFAASGAGVLTITKASTAVMLSAAADPVPPRKAVQLQAVVSVVAPGTGTPTGLVEFRANGVLLGTAPLVNGVATLNTYFKRGTHTVTATYLGSAAFDGSVTAVSHQAG